MGPYRPLRLILFIYDFIRLMVMTSLLLAFLPPVGNGEGGPAGGLFPHVFYAVPNGLFTLMSFFLWLRLDAYKPYIPLYGGEEPCGGCLLHMVFCYGGPHGRQPVQ